MRWQTKLAAAAECGGTRRHDRSGRGPRLGGRRYAKDGGARLAANAHHEGPI